MSETTLNNEEEAQDNETTTKSPVSEQRTLGGAGVTLAVMSIADVVGHMGLTGLVVGGLASYVVWRHGPEVYSLVGREIGLSEMSARFRAQRCRRFESEEAHVVAKSVEHPPSATDRGGEWHRGSNAG